VDWLKGKRGASAVTALVVVGVVIGIVVWAPWDSGSEKGLNSLGTPKTFASKPTSSGTTRRVIGQPAPSVLTQAEIAQVVAAHNRWRDKYKVAGRVEWDPTVAAVAQEWANHIAQTGQFDHRPDSGADSSPYGENLFAAWNPDPSTITGDSVTDAWGNEDADYNSTNFTCNDGKVCGHFTQVVWFNTAKIGCGKAAAPSDANQIYWVCNYDPPGNYPDVNPFTGAAINQ